MRRRAVVPSLHRKYIANMVDMFAESALHGAATLAAAQQVGPCVFQFMTVEPFKYT